MIAFLDVEATDLKPREAHLLEVAFVVTDDDLNEVSHITVPVRPVGVEIDQVHMPDVVREMHEKNGLLAELRGGGGLRRWEAEGVLIAWLVNGGDLGDVAGDRCAFCRRQREDHALVCGGLACPGSSSPGLESYIFARGWVAGGTPAALAGDVETSSCAKCGKHLEDHSVIVDERGTFTACGGEPIVWKCVPVISRTPLAGFSVHFDRAWITEHMPRLAALFDRFNIDVSSLTQLAKRWSSAVHDARPKNNEPAHRALADVRESITFLRYYRDCGFVGGGGRLS